MEYLTAAAAAKQYGPLIPPHVKIITGRTPPPKPKSASRSSAGSVHPGNEQLGVPDKHEFYDPNYENYVRMQRKLTRSRAKKLRKKKSAKKPNNK